MISHSLSVRLLEYGIFDHSSLIEQKMSNGLYKAEEPQWFDVEAWGTQAEVIANVVRKGTGLAVKGELVFDHWVDKNTGAPRSKAFIRVKLLELLGSPRERQESGAATSEIPTPDLTTIANAQF